MAERLNIFELTNIRKQQSLVICTPLASAALEAFLLEAPPVEMHGWAFGDYEIAQIATNMPREDAEEFLHIFPDTIARGGWRALAIRV